MRGSALVVVLVVLGAVLMANPLYLPIVPGEPTTAYAHAVEPVGPETPPYDESDVVERGELDADARSAFDRARESPEGGFTVEDADERAESLSYPAGPTLGDGLIVVAHEGTHYEFWTRAVERQSDVVVAQRVLLQPIAFLVGFLSVVAALAVGTGNRLRAGVDS